jgi:hypothetical protein
MRKLVSIREFLTSESYAGELMGGESWLAWRILLCACMGEPLAAHELPIFQELTGRPTSPVEPVKEFFAVNMGRRAGKSRAVASLGAYTATCVDYREVLAPGEWGELAIIAQSTSKAGKISLSGLRDPSSLGQKANSSARTATDVPPLKLRNDAAETTISICDESRIVSLLMLSTRFPRYGTLPKMTAM